MVHLTLTDSILISLVCVFIYISPHIQCRLVGILEQGFLFLLRTHLTLCFNGRVQHASADLVQF